MLTAQAVFMLERRQTDKQTDAGGYAGVGNEIFKLNNKCERIVQFYTACINFGFELVGVKDNVDSV